MACFALILSCISSPVCGFYPSGRVSPHGRASEDCGGACVIRCSKSSRPNLCNRACGVCCARCKCVPQGTYGNEASCPCYATLATRGGMRKCP